MNTLSKELREYARGVFLLDPKYAPYLTKKGRKAARKLRRKLKRKGKTNDA